MGQQLASSVLMVRPTSFRYNEETAVNNYFQKESNALNDAIILQNAQREFDEFVAILKSNHIHVVVVNGLKENDTPDALFPNNWISFHEKGKAIIYPMFAQNRRREKRSDIFDILNQNGFKYSVLKDYSSFEKKNQFLEGTGSMVLDRTNKIAYCSISERANEALFLKFCKNHSFTPMVFSGIQKVNSNWMPIYHTNVLMGISNQFVVICLDAIQDKSEKTALLNEFQRTNKEVIPISIEQMNSFAGNMLGLKSTKGDELLVLSKSAFESLNSSQVTKLEHYANLVVADLNTIETFGGGSARCMLAELF